MLDVWVQTAEGVAAPRDDLWFERIVRAAALDGGLDPAPGAEVAVLLADDATLHDLNRRFRQKDKPTDVLSFTGEAGPPGVPRHLGDIAISVERVAAQAREYGHSEERELAYLLVHGTLHLLGHDHEADEDQRAMREAEERVLAALGLGRDRGEP